VRETVACPDRLTAVPIAWRNSHSKIIDWYGSLTIGGAGLWLDGAARERLDRAVRCPAGRDGAQGGKQRAARGRACSVIWQLHTAYASGKCWPDPVRAAGHPGHRLAAAEAAGSHFGEIQSMYRGRACRVTLDMERRCDLADLGVPTRCHSEGEQRPAASMLPRSLCEKQGRACSSQHGSSFRRVVGLRCPLGCALGEGVE